MNILNVYWLAARGDVLPYNQSLLQRNYCYCYYSSVCSLLDRVLSVLFKNANRLRAPTNIIANSFCVHFNVDFFATKHLYWVGKKRQRDKKNQQVLCWISEMLVIVHWAKTKIKKKDKERDWNPTAAATKKKETINDSWANELSLNAKKKNIEFFRKIFNYPMPIRIFRSSFPTERA